MCKICIVQNFKLLFDLKKRISKMLNSKDILNLLPCVSLILPTPLYYIQSIYGKFTQKTVHSVQYVLMLDPFSQQE